MSPKRGTRRDQGLEVRLERVLRATDRDTLASALSDPSNHIVARAAERIAELGLIDLRPELEAAFERMVDPIARDKTCAAKTSIVRALESMECDAWGVFLKGVHTVQLEPAWDQPVDTAATLRAISAAALARSRDPEIVTELVELLVDKEKIARAGAAQALGNSGHHEAIPALRLKALVGDPEPEVMAECLGSILFLERNRGLEFVERFLAEDEIRVAEVAALALGQSRTLDALAILKRRFAECRHRDLSRVLLVAIAVMRLPESTSFLLERIEKGELPDAAEAISALAIFHEDSALCERMRASVDKAVASGAPERLIQNLEDALAKAAE